MIILQIQINRYYENHHNLYHFHKGSSFRNLNHSIFATIMTKHKWSDRGRHKACLILVFTYRLMTVVVMSTRVEIQKVAEAHDDCFEDLSFRFNANVAVT